MADTITITESAAADSVRDLLESDEATASEYLKESFLTEAMLALFHARRDAHLTQEQVARKMGTRQSAITRWERDFTGSISLRKYVEFALACGMLPFDIFLAPISTVRDFATAHPGQSLTLDTYGDWKSAQLAQVDNNLQATSQFITYDVTSGGLLVDGKPMLLSGPLGMAWDSTNVQGGLMSVYAPQQNFTLSQQSAGRGNRLGSDTGVGNSLINDKRLAA